jgi:D-psicose/D-tagatose/L-ribulose 3-epimerase
MKIGMNLLLWTPFVTEEHFGILKKLKATGFDGVEVPLFGGDVPHYERVGKALMDNGLGCTTCTVMPDAEHNPISADPKSRAGAVEYLKWVIDCNAALGSQVLCGPFYQPLGPSFFSGKGPTKEEKSGPPTCIARSPTMPRRPVSCSPSSASTASNATS